MMSVTEMLREAVEKQTSDIFIVAGTPITYKINGELIRQGETRLMPEETEAIVRELFHLGMDRSLDRLTATGEDDFSFSLSQMGRFRVNVYRQRGSLAAVLRVVRFELPDANELHVTQDILSFAELKKGLVLITGSAGSGKSTTLACLIDVINRSRSGHIITIEDPIEYLHRHQKSIVSQREIGQDTPDYLHALTAALREAPDVILVGEMRDLETTQTVLSAAETGHLVFSSLHTTGAANTINRIIDVFPADKQQQIRVQLSMVLQAIVSQQLVPSLDGGLIPAFEIMKVNNAIQTQIRENKIHQIDNTIQANSREGMITMDASLLKLMKAGKISRETALLACQDSELLRKRIAMESGSF